MTHAKTRKNLGWTVLNYRTIAWWKERQNMIKHGSNKWRHKGRYYHKNWESDIVEETTKESNMYIWEDYYAKNATIPKDWRDIAEGRQLWSKFTKTQTKNTGPNDTPGIAL